MGESQNQPFQLSFNRFLRVDFQGSRVTSDGGLILVRELDERFGLSELIGEHLVDSRTGRNRQFPLADLLRQSVYSRLAGSEDLNEAARLSADPTFRLIGSEKVWERGVALTSTLHWFETDLLARKANTGLIVVADHDTGGLAVSGPGGELPREPRQMILAGWTSGGHTGVDSIVWSQGPGSQALGQAMENTWIYWVMKEAIE